MSQQVKAFSVDLKVKLTSVNFEEFISAYFPGTYDQNVGQVNFLFDRLEWIGFEQLTVITGWIDDLLFYGKRVHIFLQSAKGISTDSDAYRKRKRCQDLVIKEWKLGAVLSDKIQFISGGISLSDRNSFLPNVPFEKVPSIEYKLDTFESEFDDQYQKYLRNFTEYSKTIINKSTHLNYFDNNFLNYSLVKELYSNVCQHAYQGQNDKSCYISLNFNRRIEKIKEEKAVQKFLTERYSERSDDELQFFKTKDGHYKNDSCIELSFVDFGVGIAESLKEKYLSDNRDRFKSKLSDQHENQNLHSRVLEYAFLLFTSKYEFEVDLQLHDYIPRGLYIIKDIVKRYKGMIIARSRTGKVVFDFSKTAFELNEVVHFRKDDSARNQDFSGTVITIILPTKETSLKEDVSYSKTHDTQPRLKYFSILKLYTRHRKRLYSDEKKNEKVFYERFFSDLCVTLGDFNHLSERVLVCFSFAGVSDQLKGFYIKLNYFLSYSPLINEQTNGLLFNVLDKGIGNALLGSDDNSSRGFFAHIIPCIHPDLSVTWIGINDKKLSHKLTENWKGDFHQGQFEQHHPEFLIDNVLNITKKSSLVIVKCLIPEFYLVNEYLVKYQERFVSAEINGKGLSFEDLMQTDKATGERIHDYNQIIKMAEEGRVFLTSNGQYQYIFLSFIEKLYKKEYRRLIGTFLVYKLFARNVSNVDITKRDVKILTVTLSSQLLGKEVLDILAMVSEPKSLSLIPLSSYYEFHKEPPFAEIEDNDLVIVVNDVISTGHLSNKITKSIDKRRQNVKIIILTIADSRISKESFPIHSDMYSLAEFPVAKISADEIDSSKEPIWINPIINAPVTMSIEKSNFDSVLLTPDQFLDFINEEDLYSVGLFRKNSVYHTYFLETDLLFNRILENKAGDNFKLMETLVYNLKNKLHEARRKSIQFSQLRVEDFVDNLGAAITPKDYQLLRESLSKLKHLAETADIPALTFDFVFYPFLSSVSIIEEDINYIFKEFVGENPIEVYPVPRIMTPKGWRFTFPPKFLNFITDDKNILILDDGSCSGETIVQIIDTVGFLKVKSITVLSVFARLEDFNREFFTRIDEIKVQYKSIPVNIYFGTHFNIPIYNKNNHPYAAELSDLKTYHNKEIPEVVKKYVEKRRTAIEAFLKNGSVKDGYLLPDFVSKRTMFRVRDILGRIDSYRLYKEDDQRTSQVSEFAKPTKKHIEDFLTEENGFNAVIAVLIHESKLIGTLHRV